MFSWAQIDFRNSTECFKSTAGKRPFWYLKNVLSPRICESSSRGIAKKPFLFIGVGNCIGIFKNTSNDRPFWELEYVLYVYAVLLDGLRDRFFKTALSPAVFFTGAVALWEYRKCPSIFFILCGYIGYRNFNIFRGFQNLMSSWVVRIFFSK